MRSFITVLICFNAMFARSQHEAKEWFFGDRIGIQLSNDSILSKHGYEISAYEGCASICSPEGGLLYYSDGIRLYDGSHKFITDSLLAHRSSKQGALFLKHPNSTQYILTTVNPSNHGFQYSIIQPGIDSSTISKKNVQLVSTSGEGQHATCHHNNRDIWVTTHDGINKYYSFLLHDTGFVCCPVTQEFAYKRKFTADLDHFKYTPSGNTLCVTTNLADKKIILQKVDKESGTFFDPVVFTHEEGPAGSEFSLSEQYLYAVDQSKSIYQYEVSIHDRSAIEGSKTIVGQTSSSNGFGYMQLTKQGFILIPTNEKYLHALISPDSPGLTSAFQAKFILLDSGRSHYALPNFNQSYLHQPSIDYSYQQDCSTNSYSFEGKDTFGATNFTWKFQHPDGTVKASKSSRNVSFTFQDPGKWEVLFVASNSSRSDTIAKIITVYPILKQGFLGPDTFFCELDKGILLRTPKNLHCIHWMADKTYGQIDSFWVDTPGTYFTKVTNKSFCTVYDTIKIRQMPNPPKPDVIRSDDTLSCSIDATDYQWYLNGQEINGANNKNHIPKENGSYSVMAVNSHGCTNLSDEFMVGFVSIPIINQGDMKIYPNPGSGLIHIQSKNQLPARIEIFSSHGQKITSISFPGQKTLNLDSGVYWFRIECEAGINWTEKVIVH